MFRWNNVLIRNKLMNIEQHRDLTGFAELIAGMVILLSLK